MSTTDKLAQLFRYLAAGRFPPEDGAVEVLPGPVGPVDAVLGFTAHHVVAAPVDPDEVYACLDPADVGGPLKTAFLHWLARRLGSEPATHDVVMIARGSAAPPPADLRPIEVPADHPRALRAGRFRADLSAWSSPGGQGILLMGRGLAGRLEVSFEVEPAARRAGLGTALAAAAPGLSGGEPVFAQVAPGNATSVRALLRAGYVPIGAEVLFPRRR